MHSIYEYSSIHKILNLRILILINNTSTLDIPYFTRNELEDATNSRKYLDSLLWAVSTMTGCTFGDVTARTFLEMLVTLFVFLIGASILAKTFGDFASLNHLLSVEST